MLQTFVTKMKRYWCCFWCFIWHRIDYIRINSIRIDSITYIYCHFHCRLFSICILWACVCSIWMVANEQTLFSNNLYYQWRKIYNYQYLDCFQAKHSCEIFITATYSCNWIIPMAIKQHILLKYKVEHRNKTRRMQLHCWTSKCQIFHLTKI